MIRKLVWLGILYVVLIGWRTPPYGIYLEGLDVMYCTTASVCYHEIAHKMDRDLGYPSRSHEWSDALRLVVVTEARLPAISTTAGMILWQPGMLEYDNVGATYGSSAQQELYANLYQQANGVIEDIHPILQPFYSQDPSYDRLAECLLAGVGVCRKALRLPEWGFLQVQPIKHTSVPPSVVLGVLGGEL